MVNKKWLMIANALLWMAAGFNILRGITLRHIGAVPEAFFTFFYTGLGGALFTAGAKSLVSVS